MGLVVEEVARGLRLIGGAHSVDGVHDVADYVPVFAGEGYCECCEVGAFGAGGADCEFYVICGLQDGSGRDFIVGAGFDAGNDAGVGDFGGDVLHCEDFPAVGVGALTVGALVAVVFVGGAGVEGAGGDECDVGAGDAELHVVLGHDGLLSRISSLVIAKLMIQRTQSLMLKQSADRCRTVIENCFYPSLTSTNVTPGR